MSLFPVFLKLAGKTAVVVGAGSMARAKIEQLLAAGARVRVITKSDLTTREHEGRVSWERKDFEDDDVIGAAIVIAATGRREVDRAVYRACEERGVLCNAVDDPEFCDFYTPAVVRRGDLQIAISTNGQSPALAQQIRQQLEGRFGEEWTHRVDVLGSKRRRTLAKMKPGEERLGELHRQAREALEQSSGDDGVRPGRLPVARAKAS